MDDINRFLLVAEVKSISRAAKILRVSQPALSRTISQLEKRFQAALFHRTAAGVELTPAGSVLYEKASTAARSLRDAEEEINVIKQAGELTLTIAAGDGWGFGILPPIMRQFAGLYPSVQLRLDVVDHDTRMTGLRNGNYELAFGIVSPTYESSPVFRWSPVVRVRYGIYCRTGHLLLKKHRVSPADLASASWINHHLEYDIQPSQLLNSGRRYPLRTNTMLNAIEVVRGSDLLISTAKPLRDLFKRNGIVYLMEDPISPLFVSGPIQVDGAPLRPPARRFMKLALDYCKTQDW